MYSKSHVVCVCVCVQVTKIFSKKKTGITYSFKSAVSLCGMQVYLFETPRQYFFSLPGNVCRCLKCGAKRVLCERNERVYIQYLTRLPSILILLLVWSHTLQEQKWGRPPVMLRYAVCCLEHKCWRMCVSVHVGACVCLFSWETKAEKEKSQRNPPIIGLEP